MHLSRAERQDPSRGAPLSLGAEISGPRPRTLAQPLRLNFALKQSPTSATSSADLGCLLSNWTVTVRNSTSITA